MKTPIRDKGVWKLGSRSGTSQRKIKDGVSKTVIISELLPDPAQDDIRGVWVSGAAGAAAYMAYTPPNSGRGDKHVTYLWEEGQPLLNNEITVNGGDWIAGCTKKPIDVKMICAGTGTQNGDEWAAARSKHAGGVVISYADSGTRFITSEVELYVWQALNSRSGSENVAADQL